MVDLDEDLFVSCAHQTACCDLYYRYGMYLAPATAVLTTVKHCDWGTLLKVKRKSYTTFEQSTDGQADTE